MGAQVVGGIASADASEKQGRSQQRYYDYLAGQNEITAKETLKAADQQTTFIQDDAAGQTKLVRASGRLAAGAQRAALAANGVSLSSVSAEDLARDSFNREELDAEAVRHNADTKSYETQMQASMTAKSLRSQAVGYRMGGANAAEAGRLNAQTSLLGTATSVANTYYGYSQTSKGASPSAPSYKTVSGKQVLVAPPNYYKRGY
jgi:hypothetical protein